MDRNSQTTQPRYGFPKSQLDQTARELQDFVLIGENGQIWTSAPDAKNAHRLIEQATKVVQPEGVSG